MFILEKKANPHCLVRWLSSGMLIATSPSSGNFRLHSKPAAAANSLQSCLTLRNPTDGSPPGSPGPGILQATTMERVAISFSNA